MTELRTGRFELDGVDGPAVFDGYTRGDLWNGYACPLFTRETADAVVVEVNSWGEDYALRYDGAGDAYLYGAEGEDDAEPFGGVDTEVGRLYSIGGWSWCWMEVR